MKETLKRIQNRIESSKSMSEEAKEEILGLLADLESEIEEMSQGEAEEAVRSALGLTEISAHESARSDKDRVSTLKEQTFGALQTAITELEASHPRMAEAIARISNILSRMGI